MSRVESDSPAPASVDAFVPLSVRHGGPRKRLGWWLKGRRETVALWLAPWLYVPYREDREEAFKDLAEVAYLSRDAVWTSPRVLVKVALEHARGKHYARLFLNQQRLERAIRTRPGYEHFNGTPESAVGVAAEMVEGKR